MSAEPYYLYGMIVSPYAGKVRSYLRKKHITFEERLPTHPHFGSAVVPQLGGGGAFTANC